VNKYSEYDAIQNHLSITATLIETILESFMESSDDLVMSREALSALSANRFNDGATIKAFDFVRCYGKISDCITILDERIRIAIASLDKAMKGSINP